MNILCTLHAHRPGYREVWNEGYFFSSCERCGRDLIRTDSEWRAIPRGHRVVWRNGPYRHSLASGFRRNLPAPYITPGLARAAILLDGLKPMRMAQRTAEE